jgi:hypothetical protein
VGYREILETYLNSASKNTSDTDIFPQGTKSLLTSVICNVPSCVKYGMKNNGNELARALHYALVTMKV